MAYVKKYIGRGDYRTVWEPDINQSVDSNEDEANQRANENLFGSLKLNWSADDIRKANNTPISNVNPPSDMSTPPQNMNPFKDSNMSPQQVINMAYRLGGGTYEGAVKAAAQYGVNLNRIVANRDKNRRRPASPKAQEASNTITSLVTNTNAVDSKMAYATPYKYNGKPLYTAPVSNNSKPTSYKFNGKTLYTE